LIEGNELVNALNVPPVAAEAICVRVPPLPE
jgi:hypothetical protein